MKRSKAEEILSEIPEDLLEEILAEMEYYKFVPYNEAEIEERETCNYESCPIGHLSDLVNLAFGMDFRIADTPSSSDNLIRFLLENYDD